MFFGVRLLETKSLLLLRETNLTGKEIRFISFLCGEGQTTAQICLRNGKRFSFRLQSRPHHDSHEVIAGK